MPIIIYLVGIDGSGKTTLSKNLLTRFHSNGVPFKYLYARHVPIILSPIKILSKFFLYRKNTQFKNYVTYREIKSGFSKKHKFLSRLYAALWVLDYLLFILPKTVIKINFSKYIIVDRYVGDVVVNISVASRLTKKEIYLLLRFLHWFFPRPNHSFFLDVNEEVAFQRKDDIPAIGYLKERRKAYELIKDYYNFEIVNGNVCKKALADEVYEKIRQVICLK